MRWIGVACLAVLLSGCGADIAQVSARDERAVRAAVDRFADTMQTADGASACRMMSTAARREVVTNAEGRACSAVMHELLDWVPAALRPRTRPRVAYVVIRGDRATAGLVPTRYSGEPAPRVGLVREQGRWRLAPRPDASAWEADAATECVLEALRGASTGWRRYDDRLVVEYMERYCDRLAEYGLLEGPHSRAAAGAVASDVWREMCAEGKFSERDTRQAV
jgi:hypothetical protein